MFTKRPTWAPLRVRRRYNPDDVNRASLSNFAHGRLKFETIETTQLQKLLGSEAASGLDVPVSVLYLGEPGQGSAAE